jgi:transcriptional regulator with XRE-family HTH domain
MTTNRKKMISELVKEKRMAKGYTQKELSELSHISVRSIQRIENGEILPRSYTLKTLAEILEVSFADIPRPEQVQKRFPKLNKGQKIIFSIGISIFILLLAWGFVAQSARFPETTFELIVLMAVILLLITTILAIVWKTRS